MSDIKAQVIRAPFRPAIEDTPTLFQATPSIFLAGSVTTPDWRAPLIASLSHLPIDIFDPLRPDWDSSWVEDENYSPFREQVQWELDMQERADLVIIYFGPLTEAPISLLELGLCARSGKALVVCDPAYSKKGNVDITCRRFGVEIVDGLDGLAAAVLQRLGRGKGQDLLLRA